MRQDNAEIGVAFAGYFPEVSISGLVGYTGNPFAALLVLTIRSGRSAPRWLNRCSTAG